MQLNGWALVIQTAAEGRFVFPCQFSCHLVGRWARFIRTYRSNNFCFSYSLVVGEYVCRRCVNSIGPLLTCQYRIWQQFLLPTIVYRRLCDLRTVITNSSENMIYPSINVCDLCWIFVGIFDLVHISELCCAATIGLGKKKVLSHSAICIVCVCVCACCRNDKKKYQN